MKKLMSSLEQRQGKKQKEEGETMQAQEPQQSSDFRMDLTGHEKNYLRQLNKFNRLKWYVETEEHKAGDCFGVMAEANELLQKKQESTIAKQDTAVIVFARADYLKILEKAQEKQMIDKQEFFQQIPLFK